MNNLLKFFSQIKIPFFSSIKLYFDLGTSTTRIAIKDKGIVLKEPTFIAFNTKLKEAIFFGRDAKKILGKTPDFIKISRPLVNAIVSDFDAEVILIKYFIDKSVTPYINQSKFIKPTMSAFVGYPIIGTEIEQKAVEEVLLKAGCNTVRMIEKPIATALGVGVSVFTHEPHMIIDLGGGAIELSIISGGGIVSGKTLKTAGENMDKIIANYIYLKHGVILGEATTEKLKINALNFTKEETTILVRGKSLEDGLPKSIKIRTSEIKEALLPSFNQIVDAVKELIEGAPPEIVDEIFETGIIITGGLSSIKGLADYFHEELKIKTILADNNFDSTINGLIMLDKAQNT